MEQIVLEAIYKDVELRKVTVISQHGFTKLGGVFNTAGSCVAFQKDLDNL